MFQTDQKPFILHYTHTNKHTHTHCAQISRQFFVMIKKKERMLDKQKFAKKSITQFQTTLNRNKSKRPKGSIWSAVTVSCWKSLWISWGSKTAVQKGTKSFRIQGASVNLFVHQSVHPSVYPESQNSLKHENMKNWSKNEK